MIEVFVVSLKIVCYCEAKIVKGESRTKEKLAFSFPAEPHPILREAKVVKGESRTKEKLAFSFPAEPHPVLREAEKSLGNVFL